MFMDARGCGVRVEGGIEVTDEGIDRWRDMMILQFDRRGVSVRDIGRLLNMPKSTVHYRLRTIPPHVRDYYERQVRGVDCA